MASLLPEKVIKRFILKPFKATSIKQKTFVELFWKKSSYVSGLSVCIYVALYVRIFVAGANKVEGTMSWCVGTSEILASKRYWHC